MATSTQESPEECAFRQHSAALIHAIDAPDVFAWQLSANDIISSSVKSKALVRELSKEEKNSVLLSAVEGKIRAEPSIFGKFVTLLRVQDDLTLRNLGEKIKAAHVQASSSPLPESKLQRGKTSLSSSTDATPKRPQTTSKESGLDSNPTQPENLLDLYADYLRSVYSTSELPQYDKWPPTQTTRYISLAAISKEDVTREEADDFTRATLHGDVDQVLKRKKPIKMEEILVTESGQKPRCVLVEGGPGVGKTTFSWRMCKRWGNRELFTEYSSVVCLSLREESVQSAKEVSDLFYYSSKELQKQIAAEIVRTQGKNMLIVLDGLDELPSNLLTKSSVVGRLLSGVDLPLATVIVTSRPSVTETLTWKFQISRHIEVLGFTKQDIQDYTKSVLPTDLLPGFDEYLSINPSIHTMMYVPLNSAIVTEVYKHNRQSNKPTPATATQLYTDLSHTLLLRYLDNLPDYKGQDLELNSFSDLPPPVHAQFKKLCEIAYNGVMERQLIFSNLGRSFDHLGFMHSKTEMFCPRRPSVSHSFLHFSIQEYLAAVHISQKEPEEQMKLFKRYGTNALLRGIDQRHLDNVWQFLFGLTMLKDLDLTEVKRYLLPEGGMKVEARAIELLYETQDDRCLSILGDSIVTFNSNVSLQPSTSAALAYCITNSKCTWKLNIYFCSDDSADILCRATRAGCIHTILGPLHPRHLKELPKCILQGIRVLILVDLDREAQTWDPLAEVIRSTVNLEVLTLQLLKSGCAYGGSHLVDASHSLRILASLRVLRIRNYVLAVADVCALKDLLLSIDSRLEFLEITCYSYDLPSTKDVTVLFEALGTNRTLKTFELSNLLLSTESCRALASMLGVNQILTRLKINSDNNYMDMQHFFEALCQNTTLQEVHVHFLGQPLVFLREMIDRNQHLTKITLPKHMALSIQAMSTYHLNKHRIEFW